MMLRFLITAWLLLAPAPAIAADDAKWRTPEQLIKEAKEMECSEAKETLGVANGKCSDAKTECAQSIKEARKGCESRCDGDAAAALKLCSKQDNAVIWSCRDHAIKAQETCSAGCKNSDTITSECKSVDGKCVGVKPAQEAKNEACK